MSECSVEDLEEVIKGRKKDEQDTMVEKLRRRKRRWKKERSLARGMRVVHLCFLEGQLMSGKTLSLTDHSFLDNKGCHEDVVIFHENSKGEKFEVKIYMTICELGNLGAKKQVNTRLEED